MLFSMTGFGKADFAFQGQKYTLEIRSLNSKQMDINFRMPASFRAYELKLRSLLAEQVERGKVDFTIALTPTAEHSTPNILYPTLNYAAIDYYLHELSARYPLLTQAELLPLVMRLPEVTRIEDEGTVSEADEQQLLQALQAALTAFKDFRKTEGASLQTMFTAKLNGILELLAQVEPLENERIERIRTRLEDSLQKLSEQTQQQVDKNRLEQEMIYYLEKLDINEEKVRLRQHIHYFMETMTVETQGVGKKLGFIAQEMGREINTLGSKSNHAEMQILVVKMKDLLEQIKEQVLNVL